MAQTVRLRRSSVSGQKPQNTNLQLGEIALNTTDGKAFMAKSGSLGPSVEEFILTNTVNTGSINLIGDVTASHFSGDATGLSNVPFVITGSDVDGANYDKQFTKLHFDSDTGLNVSESAPGTAFISIGSHFRDIFVSGSDLLRATGSDSFEIIPEGGVDITTSITDTNGNGYVKELTISTTNLSSSLNDRMDIITGSIDSLNDFSSSVVLTSQTGSMTVMSASYALTASYALNASAGGGGGATGTYSLLTQAVAATTWSFEHNTGQRYPIFQVFNDDGDVIIPTQIRTIDENNAEIIFGTAQSGKVVASLGGGNGMTEEFTNSNLWVVDHNLGTDYPDVTIWDSNRNIIFPDRIESVNSNQIKVYFSIPVSGHVSVSRGGHIISGSVDLEWASILNKPAGLVSGSDQLTGSYDDRYVLSGSITQTTWDNIANKPAGIVSGSIQVEITGTTGYSTFSSSIATTDFNQNQRLDSIEGTTSSLNSYTSSTDLRIDSLETESGSIRSGFNSFTSSYTTGSFTGSFIGDGSGLYNIPASGVTGLQLDKIVNGNASASIDDNGMYVNRDLYVAGTITAEEIHTTYVTSSVLFQSGSTKFGDTSDDTHRFTGSVYISGSIVSTDTTLVSGSSQIIYNGLTGIPSGIVSGSEQVLDLLVNQDIDLGTGTITAFALSGSLNIPDSSTLSIGSQIFYPQGTNGFSVNEDFDPSNSSTQTAYHFTSGQGRETVAFTLARTGQFTDGFGIYGTAANNTFVMFGEQNNTSFEWRRGVGIRPLDLDGGTLMARISSDGQFWANSISSSLGITGSFTGSYIGDGAGLYNIPASGVTGLNLTQIADGAVTASISSVDGFIVNTDTIITGSVNITGSLILNGDPVGTGKLDSTEFYTYTSSTDLRLDSLESETGSYATTGSNSFIGNENINGNLSVTGSVVISGSLDISDANVGGSRYLHTEGSSAATWSITHNLDYSYPNVTVYDGATNKVMLPSDVISIDANTTQVTFATPEYGYALVSVGGVSTASADRYLHTQSSATGSWVIDHSIGYKYVTVNVYDENDEQLIPQKITAVSVNRTQIDFAAPTSGNAIITVGGPRSTSIFTQTGSFYTTQYNIGITGSLVVSGDVDASSFNTTSDKTLKTNLERIEGALDKIDQLNGYTFDWISDYSDDKTRQIGMIANEVHEVQPELISKRNIMLGGKEEEIMLLDYSKVTALLIEGIKELKDRVSKLENKRKRK